MRWLTLLIPLVLVLPAAAAAPFEIVRNPSPDQVKTAVAALKEARKSKDAEVRVMAIRANAGIVDRKVVNEVAKFMRKGTASSKIEAANALGWMPSRDALKQLHRYYRRNKDLSKQEALFAQVLKAIGRHGDKSSLSVLTSDPFKHLTLASGKARILGIGRIRSRDSVEFLVKAMRLGGNERNRGRTSRVSEPRQRFMPYARLALASLTGVDKGTSKDAWQAWWKENKRAIKVSKNRPSLSEKLRKQWEAYWGEDY